MREVKVISHTADVGIRVKADSLEELFKGALEGLADIQKENMPAAAAHTESIDIESPDCTALLVDFLSEAHSLSDMYNIIFTKLEVKSLTDTHLIGSIKGVKVETFDEDIKAVTHSQADIIENKEGNLETVIIFDL